MSDADRVNESEETTDKHPLLDSTGKTLNEDVANRKWMYWISFFIIGTVTNLGYVMVGSAAQDLAKEFGKENLMPMFQLCLIICGAGTKFINSKFLMDIPHKYRIYFNVGLQIASYALISFVTIVIFEAGFWLALLASLMHGTTAGLSESTSLAYIRGFPSLLIGAFSSGTGMSGILGTTTLLVFKSFTFFKEHEGYIFVIMSSSIIAYFFSFNFLFRMKAKYPYTEERARSSSLSSMIEDEKS
jgi:battenin